MIRAHSYLSPDSKENRVVPRVKLPTTQARLSRAGDNSEGRSSFVHSSPLLRINGSKKISAHLELKHELPAIEKQRRKHTAKVNEYLRPYYNSARNSKSHQQSMYPSQDYINSEQSSILHKPHPSPSPPRSKPKLTNKLDTRRLKDRLTFTKQLSFQGEPPRSKSTLDSHLKSRTEEHQRSMNIEVPYSLPIDEMHTGESESVETRGDDKRSLPV